MLLTGWFNSVVTDADWETIYRWYGQAPLASVLGDTLGAPSVPPSEPDASTVIGLHSDDDSDDDDGSDDDGDSNDDRGDTLGAQLIPPSESDASTVLGLLSDDDSNDDGDSDNDNGGDTLGAQSISSSEREASTVLSLLSDSDSDNSGDSDDDDGSDDDDESDDDDGSDGDSAVADLDGFAELEIDDSPAHGGDINTASPRTVIDLTLDSEDEKPKRESADPHPPQSLSPPSDNTSDTRSRSESLFVRSDNASDKRSRSESLFVRSDSVSSGGVKAEEPEDQKKRFVIDLTTIDEETEPSSQDMTRPPKGDVVPPGTEGQLQDGSPSSSKRKSMDVSLDEPDSKRRRTDSAP